MKLPHKINRTIQKLVVKKLVKNRRRPAEFHNLETARSIHLYFDAKTESNYLTAKKFISELKEKNIRIQAAGMTATEEQKAQFLFHREVSFITPKETNFFGKPPKNILEEINREHADIFINLCTQKCFTGQYLSAFSDAKFKVSGIPDDPTADFVIDVSKKNSVPYLAEQCKHFLSTIKKARPYE